MIRRINKSILGYLICGIVIVILFAMIQHKNTQLVEVNNRLNTLQDITVEVNNQLMEDNESQEVEINRLKSEQLGLNTLIDQLQSRENQLKLQIETMTLFNRYREDVLERLVYPDVDVITKSLYDHPEMIGVSAILGGTMYFNQVYVLDEQYVYATFDDGHLDGGGLYRYIYQDDEIKWSRISDHAFDYIKK